MAMESTPSASLRSLQAAEAAMMGGTTARALGRTSGVLLNTVTAMRTVCLCTTNTTIRSYLAIASTMGALSVVFRINDIKGSADDKIVCVHVLPYRNLFVMNLRTLRQMNIKSKGSKKGKGKCPQRNSQNQKLLLTYNRYH